MVKHPNKMDTSPFLNYENEMSFFGENERYEKRVDGRDQTKSIKINQPKSINKPHIR